MNSETSDAVDVLLNLLVEGVVGREDLLEGRVDELRDEEKEEEDNRDDDEEDPGQLPSGDEAHDGREDHHERCPHDGPDDLHESVLDVGDVGRRPGDDGRSREVVDVLEGIGLDLHEHRFPEVLGEAGGAGGSPVAGRDAGDGRDDGQPGDDAGIHVKVIEAFLLLARHLGLADRVDHVLGEEGNEDLASRLNENHGPGQERFSPVAMDEPNELFDCLHLLSSSLSSPSFRRQFSLILAKTERKAPTSSSLSPAAISSSQLTSTCLMSSTAR